MSSFYLFCFFFFNDTATTEIYTLSLHDALPISGGRRYLGRPPASPGHLPPARRRSEEHTSELQSLTNIVCRLLLEKKKKNKGSLFLKKKKKKQKTKIQLTKKK